jgi:hypothetical protein
LEPKMTQKNTIGADSWKIFSQVAKV